jgi:hypothetical protein
VQLKQLRLLSWVRQLEIHIKTAVTRFEETEQSPHIRAGQMVIGGDEEKAEDLALPGSLFSLPVVGVELPGSRQRDWIGNETYLMGFCRR